MCDWSFHQPSLCRLAGPYIHALFPCELSVFVCSLIGIDIFSRISSEFHCQQKGTNGAQMLVRKTIMMKRGTSANVDGVSGLNARITLCLACCSQFHLETWGHEGDTQQFGHDSKTITRNKKWGPLQKSVFWKAAGNGASLKNATPSCLQKVKSLPFSWGWSSEGVRDWEDWSDEWRPDVSLCDCLPETSMSHC